MHEIAWFAFGFTVRLVLLLGASPVILASRISRWEEQHPIVPDDDEPEPEPVPDPDLAEAIATAEFYKSLYLEEAQRMRV